MQATFPGVEFLRILFRFKKIKETSSSYVHVLRHVLHIKRRIRRFHVEVLQWTSKKCTKKRDAREELLFWSLNLLFFWSRLCGRRLNCFKSSPLFQIYLGYKRKTVYEKFFGGKKRCITGDAKVLKWRIPIFQTFLGGADWLVHDVLPRSSKNLG